MTEHTPGPWSFDGHGINASGERIAKMAQAPYNYDTGQPVRNEIFEANARFIVTACNCHADLLEACKLTAAIIIDCYDACDEPLNEAWKASVKAVRHVEEQT